MRGVACLVVFVAMTFFTGVCVTHASPMDDAKALAEKAAAYVKANGKDKGLAEINDPKGQFVKGELYVVAGDLNGTALANPTQPKLQGVSLLEVKDPNGKLFMKEVVEIAKTKGSGWTAFTWTNSTTKKVQPKKLWVKRVEGTDIWVMCGVWQ